MLTAARQPDVFSIISGPAKIVPWYKTEFFRSLLKPIVSGESTSRWAIAQVTAAKLTWHGAER
jgi:hypothetical protein